MIVHTRPAPSDPLWALGTKPQASAPSPEALGGGRDLSSRPDVVAPHGCLSEGVYMFT